MWISKDVHAHLLLLSINLIIFALNCPFEDSYPQLYWKLCLTVEVGRYLNNKRPTHNDKLSGKENNGVDIIIQNKQ